MKLYYEEPGITIYHGDCREVLPHLDPVDLVLTDPPFLPVFGTTEDRNDIGNFLIVETWMEVLAKDWHSILVPSGHLILMCDWRTYPCFWRAVMRGRWEQRNLVVWAHMAGRKWGVFRFCHQLAFVVQKPPRLEYGAPPGKQYDVWRSANVPTCERQHPTEKPIDYLRYLLGAISAQIVLDPFMGSGTTLVAAKQLGRRAIGIEIEERYCEMAVKRLSQEMLPLEPPLPQPEQLGLTRCDREIAEAKAALLAEHPDVEGLTLSISDWSAERRLVETHGRKSS